VGEGLHFKEPTRTFAPATAATCIAGSNLAAATDHYGNCHNLGSTAITTWEARKDLATLTNLQFFNQKTCGNYGHLSSTSNYSY